MASRKHRNYLILSLFLYCFVLVFPFVVPKGEMFAKTFSLLFYILNEGDTISFFGFIVLCILFITFYQLMNIEVRKIQRYGFILIFILNLIILSKVRSIKDEVTIINGFEIVFSIFFYVFYIIYIISLIISFINYVVAGTKMIAQKDIETLYYNSIDKQEHSKSSHRASHGDEFIKRSKNRLH